MCKKHIIRLTVQQYNSFSVIIFLGSFPSKFHELSRISKWLSENVQPGELSFSIDSKAASWLFFREAFFKSLQIASICTVLKWPFVQTFLSSSWDGFWHHSPGTQRPPQDWFILLRLWKGSLLWPCLNSSCGGKTLAMRLFSFSSFL